MAAPANARRPALPLNRRAASLFTVLLACARSNARGNALSSAAMQMILSIALGGAIGAVSRHFVNRASMALWGASFPWGTLIVNVAGSFLMGVIVGWMARNGQASQELRGFLTVGFLGALTTFSSFSLDAVTLFERGAHIQAVAYVLANVVLALGGLVLGLAVMRLGAPA